MNWNWLKRFAAVLLTIAGFSAIVAAPAQAHVYASCENYYDLGTVYDGNEYVSLLYTTKSWSGCSDVNLTHMKNGNFAALTNAQVRCEIVPPTGAPYTGTYFNLAYPANLHQIIEVCVGVPNGWRWRVRFKTALNEPGPVYFGVSF